jgi:aminoglycoside phosphotransferase (APT) family kinase protein
VSAISSEVLDPVRLCAWLDEHKLGSGPVRNTRILAGGTQNIVIRFDRGEESFVLRRPALHPRPEAVKTIRREAAVLRALKNTGVPHPRFIAGCDDPDIIGVHFYLMAEAAGFNVCVAMPAPVRDSPRLRHKIGLALVDGIVALSKVDPFAVGLNEFGKLDGYLQRQVPRWAAQLESYRQFSDWPGAVDLGPVGEIGSWLEDHLPAECQPGLMHGDCFLGNALFLDTGELSALLDWELSAMGDPLLDLGRLLASWPDSAGEGPLSLKIEPWSGFPERDELIARYESGTRRQMGDLIWFEVLACYKLGIILEGTYARACAGLADTATGLRLHRSAIALLRRATDSLTTRT